MRILIVEDELIIAIDLEEVLSEEGHQVAGIARGSETALGLAQRLKPDLALVDVHLVDGDTGPEIAPHLKEMGIPVLFMTANASTLPDGMAGALGILPKPVATHVVKQADRSVAGPGSDPPD